MTPEQYKAFLDTQLPKDPTYRADAAYDTMFLARQLTQIETEVYRVQYADLKFRQIVPIKNTGLNPGAASFVYSVWDWFGVAKFISSFADDLPRVGIRAKEVASLVHSLGDSYGYSLLDLMQASMAGISLDSEEAKAAAAAIERKLDYVAALGEPALGMLGWANQPNVTVSSPAANGAQNGGGGTSTQFRHKTAEQILMDLDGVAADMAVSTFETFIPDTIVMPPSLYAILAVQRTSNLNTTETTLSNFLKVSPYIKRIETWNRLERAGATGGPRIVFQKSDPQVGQFYIPMEAKTVPPQERNLAIVVNLWARTGGFVLRQPLGMRYVDLAGPVPA
jgi:hypothetical protein